MLIAYALADLCGRHGDAHARDRGSIHRCSPYQIRVDHRTRNTPITVPDTRRPTGFFPEKDGAYIIAEGRAWGGSAHRAAVGTPVRNAAIRQASEIVSQEDGTPLSRGWDAFADATSQHFMSWECGRKHRLRIGAAGVVKFGNALAGCDAT